MGTRIIEGQLEIDEDRGVIYFHTMNEQAVHEFSGVTILRICHLPTPIKSNEMLDITHMIGTSWGNK